MSFDSERLLTDDEEDKLASLNLTPKQATKVRDIWQSENGPKKPIKNELFWNILLTVAPIIFLIDNALEGPFQSVALVIAMICVWFRIILITAILLPGFILLIILRGRKSYYVFNHGCLRIKNKEYQKEMQLGYLYQIAVFITLFFTGHILEWRCLFMLTLFNAIFTLFLAIKIDKAMAMAEAE